MVLPSMTDFIDAKDKDITVLTAWMVGVPPGSMGIKGSRTKVVRTETVRKERKDTVFIDGSDSRTAALELISEVR